MTLIVSLMIVSRFRVTESLLGYSIQYTRRDVKHLLSSWRPVSETRSSYVGGLMVKELGEPCSMAHLAQ